MLVLIATDELAGTLDTDHHHALDGELVAPIVLDCIDRYCEYCSRAWVGLASNGGTTTAMVAERPDLTDDVLRRRIRDWLDRTGELAVVEEAAEAGEYEVGGKIVDDRVAAVDELVGAHLAEIQAVCARFAVGTVVTRMGQLVAARQQADAA